MVIVYRGKHQNDKNQWTFESSVVFNVVISFMMMPYVTSEMDFQTLKYLLH